MEPLSPLNEAHVKSFFKSATPEDVEVYFNSLVKVWRHNDRDKNITADYTVRLTDAALSTYTYEVSSNAIGLEAIRILTQRHHILNGGSDSENSRFIGLYRKEN